MKNRIVTISREFGSGGRIIGKAVAEKLGIPCYDAELVQKLAKESGFAEDYVKQTSECMPGGHLESLFANRTLGPTNEDILWDIQNKVILEIAQKGPCVIVGRCADYILREKADCLKVFIHAAPSFRAQRIVKEYGERGQSAQRRLRDKDKRRAAYHRFYTDIKWGDSHNYHISLDSGVLGMERCTEIISALFLSRKGSWGRMTRFQPSCLRKSTHCLTSYRSTLSKHFTEMRYASDSSAT